MPAIDELVGTDVLYRRWAAPSAKAVFLLVHGLGAHSARWDFLASFLARNGYASYGIELKGFGRTPERPRGHIGSYRVWDRDILALRETAVRENPGRKVFLLGENLGGLVVFNLAARYPDRFAGQVLISPAFKNGLKFPISLYLALPFLMVVNPQKTVSLPFTSAMCTRDAAYQEVMDHNPDEVRVASLSLLAKALGERMTASRLAKNLSVPSLFLIAGMDSLVDERAGRKRVDSKHGLITTLACGPEGKAAYALEGSVFIAGAAIQWLRDQLGLLRTAAESEAMARAVEDNAGVYFVPAFVGLGAPYWDAAARGTIVGLTRGAGRNHLVRAALEAMAYSTRDVLETMRKDSGLKIRELRIDGGTAANEFLCQFQADILGIPVLRPKTIETTSLGAAYLAGLAAGFWKDTAEIGRFWTIDKRFVPVMPHRQAEALYRGWKAAVARVLT